MLGKRGGVPEPLFSYTTPGSTLRTAILSTKRFRHWLFSALCKTLLLAAETTETKARLGINSGNSFLNRNEPRIQRILYKNDDTFAVLKHQNNRHFRFSLG